MERLSVQLDGFALGPIDLRLHSGSSAAVIGPSGAGKTTLLRAIAGWVPTTSGRIRSDERDLTHAPPEDRSAVYVPQGLALFPHRTVEENVGFPQEIRGGDRDRRELRSLMDAFGLLDLARRRPSTLSTGEQHRVAAARAMAAHPDLLLWDEPLAALDLPAREELLETLRKVRSDWGATLLVVTHDPAMAFSLADRLLVLERGVECYGGDVAGLLADPPNRFAARFAGFDNIYAPEQLSSGGPFARWLLQRSGPEGVGLRAPLVDPEGSWTGEVRSLELALGGYACRATVDGLPLRLRGIGAPTLRPGERARFSVLESSTVAIGARPTEER